MTTVERCSPCTQVINSNPGKPSLGSRNATLNCSLKMTQVKNENAAWANATKQGYLAHEKEHPHVEHRRVPGRALR